jgi:hypothetical protein
VRYLDEIRSYKELRQVRREMDMKVWTAEEELSESVVEAFSADNILSFIAPQGSVIDRLVGGFDTVLATVRGIIRGVELFRSRR